MDFVIRFSLNKPKWVVKYEKQLIIAGVLLACLALVVTGGYWGLKSLDSKYNVRSMVGNFFLANVAHQLAGDQIPFEGEELGYLNGVAYDKNYTWGIDTNSEWIAEQMRLIVPFFSYEKLVSRGRYPPTVIFFPFRDTDSFHVGGRAVPMDYIYLNERYAIDSGRWLDQRQAFSTLVHELIHLQGGAFLSGSSEKLESATSAATLEVLAAMCNYQNELACRAFWDEVESLARTSLMVEMGDNGLMPLYEFWADTFWRDASESRAHYKSNRYWSENQAALTAIMRKYSLKPWKEIILPGVLGNRLLNTENVTYVWQLHGGGIYKILGMPFDDIAYLLKPFSWILRWCALTG